MYSQVYKYQIIDTIGTPLSTVFTTKCNKLSTYTQSHVKEKCSTGFFLVMILKTPPPPLIIGSIYFFMSTPPPPPPPDTPIKKVCNTLIIKLMVEYRNYYNYFLSFQMQAEKN